MLIFGLIFVLNMYFPLLICRAFKINNNFEFLVKINKRKHTDMGNYIFFLFLKELFFLYNQLQEIFTKIPTLTQ